MRSIAGVSPALHWLRGLAEEADYLLAAEVKALNWQQEFEADEVACAVMARLRLSSDHMSACAHVTVAAVSREYMAYLQQLLTEQQQLSPLHKQMLADQRGWPADFDATVALYKASVERGDPDVTVQLLAGFRAARNQRQLLHLAWWNSTESDEELELDLGAL